MRAKKAVKKAVTKKRPTNEERAAMVEVLTKIKPTVRHFTAFGEDHHAAIEAQCDVIERLMSDDAIFTKYSPDEAWGQSRPQNVMDAALDARRWLDGQEVHLLDDWKELARK
jgi:hypothetical protein